jgi:hypothetical protein
MEETNDNTDYVSTINPELLNLNKDDDCCLSNKCCFSSNPSLNVSCRLQTCNYMNYFIILLFFGVLFQIIFRLKLVYIKLGSILNLATTISYKIDALLCNIKKTENVKEKLPEPKPTEVCDNINLNYILDIIKQIDNMSCKKD